MIVPFRYRLGIELAHRTARALLAEQTGDRCRIVGSIRQEIEFSVERSDNEITDLLRIARQIVPPQSETVLVSLVMPAEHVIESSVQIPKDVGVEREEWERWDMSMHLPESPNDYWYESSHVRDSVCGRFSVRRIRAVKKSFAQNIKTAAEKLGMFIDKLLIPQSVWGRIVPRYCSSQESAKTDCVYLGSRFLHLLRQRECGLVDMSSVEISSNGDTRQPIETVATLLSWHRGRSRGNRRVIIDGGGAESIRSSLMSKFGFSTFDAGRLPKRVSGGLEGSESYLLPLAALGVI